METISGKVSYRVVFESLFTTCVLYSDAWRDRQDEVKEQRYPRGRSLSSWVGAYSNISVSCIFNEVTLLVESVFGSCVRYVY